MATSQGARIAVNAAKKVRRGPAARVRFQAESRPAAAATSSPAIATIRAAGPRPGTAVPAMAQASDAWSQPLTQARPAAGQASRADRLRAMSGERRPGQPQQQHREGQRPSRPSVRGRVSAEAQASAEAARMAAIDQPMAVASGGSTSLAEKNEPGRPMTRMTSAINSSGGHPPARNASEAQSPGDPVRPARQQPVDGRQGRHARGSCRRPARPSDR